MNNHEFCAHWLLAQDPGRGLRVLDYGCGSGQLVALLRAEGVQAFGCDVFYEGGDYAPSVDPRLFEAGVIRRMEGSAIPFGTASFDAVINNQVMEHVEHLDPALAEIQRVLKPGGQVLSLFPDQRVWREGHCGIPFLHWFPKHSRGRVYYAAGLRLLGFGYHTGGKGALTWSRDFCAWLDTWTHYRTREDIHSAYRRQFQDIDHLEDTWLQQRLGGRKAWVAWWPARLQRWAARKLGGMVFVARKAPEPCPLPGPGAADGAEAAGTRAEGTSA